MDRLYGGTVNMFGFRTKETGADWRAELHREIECLNEKYGLRLNPVVIIAEADIARLTRSVPRRATTPSSPPLPLFLPESPEAQEGWSGSEGDEKGIMDGGAEWGTKALEKELGTLIGSRDEGSPDKTLVETIGLSSLPSAKNKMSAPTKSTWRKVAKRKMHDDEQEQPKVKKSRQNDLGPAAAVVSPEKSAVVSQAGGDTSTCANDEERSRLFDGQTQDGTMLGAKKVNPKFDRRSKTLAALAKRKREKATEAGRSGDTTVAHVAAEDLDPKYMQTLLIKNCQTAAAEIVYKYKTTKAVDFPQTRVFLDAFDKLKRVNLAHRRSGKSQREVRQLMEILHKLHKIDVRSINGQDGGQLLDVKGKAKLLIDKYEKDNLDGLLEVHDSSVLSCH